MKKNTLFKKTILACSLATAIVASCSLMAQSGQAMNRSEKHSSSGIQPLDHNESIVVTVTPLGTFASQSEITLKEGDELTITGKVLPDPGYTFESIEAKLNEYHFLPVLKSESDMKQTDSGFSFRFKANSEGKEKITFNTTWSKDGSSKTEENLAPIEVTVQK